MIKTYNFPNNLVLDFDILDLAGLICLRFRASDFGFQLGRFPFEGEANLFLGVALLTAWDHVPFGTLSAASNGDQMIHGKLTCWELTPTVVAYSLRPFLFPPLG
jgi:hypothetical protein